jgi:hypothetical protein
VTGECECQFHTCSHFIEHMQKNSVAPRETFRNYILHRSLYTSSHTLPITWPRTLS